MAPPRRVAALAVLGFLALLAAWGLMRKRPPSASARSAHAPHPAVQRSPVVHLFPPERDAPRPLLWDASGRRVLWRSDDTEEPGNGEPPPPPRPSREDGALRLRLPIAGALPVPAAEVSGFRLRVALPVPQKSPPVVRVVVHTSHLSIGGYLAESVPASGRPAGEGWLFDLETGDRAHLAGTVAAVEIEMLRLDGETFRLLSLEILGASLAEGFVSYSEDGDTRLVWAGRAGHALSLHGRVPVGGRLLGDVACHPASRSLPGPLIAEVAVSTTQGEVSRRRYALETSPVQTNWIPYAIPLSGLAGHEVTVQISVPAGPPGAAALWTEPMLMGGPERGSRGLVLVSVDTLRADAVLPLAGEPSMPLLAARARREGQIVWHHYAASNWTLPAHASMLTGRYPSAHGATGATAALDASIPGYLPRRLAQEGFHCVGLVDGGWVSANWGFASGFDRYREARLPGNRPEWHEGAYRALVPQLRGADFFLFLHSYFVHDYARPAPADPAPTLEPLLEAYHREHEGDVVSLMVSAREGAAADPRLRPLARALYQARAKSFDVWLDRFLDELDADFREAPPIVAVTSDHGESLGDGPEGRCWMHGYSLQDVEIRVPLVLFHADRRPRPAVTDLTSQVDLVPTLLTLLGVAYSAADYVGVDLLDAGALSQRPQVYAEQLAPSHHWWAAVSRTAKMVADTVLTAKEAHPAPPRLYRGEPGLLDEAGNGTAGGAEAAALASRRRTDLYASVDGLFLEVDNPTAEPCSLTVDLTPVDSTRPVARWWEAAERSQVQPYLLEPDDWVRFGSPSPRAIRLGFSLSPGDADLIVVRQAGEFRLEVPEGERILLAVGGALVPGNQTLVGRRRTPSSAGPPALVGTASDRPTIRVWENEPAGAARALPPAPAVSEETRERLRALGYIN